MCCCFPSWKSVRKATIVALDASKIWAFRVFQIAQRIPINTGRALPYSPCVLANSRVLCKSPPLKSGLEIVWESISQSCRSQTFRASGHNRNKCWLSSHSSRKIVQSAEARRPRVQNWHWWQGHFAIASMEKAFTLACCANAIGYDKIAPERLSCAATNIILLVL